MRGCACVTCGANEVDLVWRGTHLGLNRSIRALLRGGVGLTDESQDSSLSGTSGNQVGDKLTAVIDLKSKQPIREIHLYQHDNYNYHLLLAELSISTDNVKWTKVKYALL